MGNVRTAVITNELPIDPPIGELFEFVDRVNRYLPANYTAVAIAGEIVVVGKDNAGWTLDDYVIPRCATGMIFMEEVVQPLDF